MKNCIPVSIVLFLAMLAACKKDKDNKTEKIYGTWRHAYTVLDTNNNNKMDNDQYVDPWPVRIFTFTKGGSGTVTCEDPSCIIATFQWDLQNKDTELRLISSSSSTTDTLVYPITSLTSDKMILSTGTGVAAWNIYERK